MRSSFAALPFLVLLSSCIGSDPQAEKAKNARPTAPPSAESPEKQARKAKHAPRDGTSKFDFYVLALSWSPQHCASPSGARDEMQCSPGRLYDFVLHGMWPQYEKGWPQDCTKQQVDRATVDSMLDIMPSPKLVRHEWSKHGTCSGLEPKDYFADARSAFQSIRIPDQYKRPKLQVMSNPKEMRKRFAAANPKVPEDGFAVVCSGRYLQEVRVCLTTDFEPRSCNKEVLRDQCRVDEMILRPVR